jgi:tetratricopeptide (TPR) repeat protein
MEYLEGVELGSVIEREGALDVARALKITGQICRALAAAHREGIIHRDLKPENIFLITRDGTADVVKVLDFGIAKTTEAEAARERRLTSPGMAMGTPEYMSPEQAAGRAADARCDVYALGAIMYEMVTGVPPYCGDNFMEILTKKATQDPPPPGMVRSELPSQVSDLVTASMARNPDDRPQTMEALEYELNKCLAGRGVAVAQILGMTTDPHVVATLNPGLSMRQFDDAVVVSRAQTASPPIGLTRPGSHSGMTELPAMWSGPTVSTGQNQLMVRQASEPAATQPAQSMPMRAQSSPAITAPPAPAMSDPGMQASPPIVVLQRSWISVFGWLVLAAVLFGGVGTLLYLALGERNAAKAVASDVAGAASRVPQVQAAVLQPERSGPEAEPLGSMTRGRTGSGQVTEAATREPPVPEPDAVSGGGPNDDVKADRPVEPPRRAGEDRPRKLQRTPTRAAPHKRVAQAAAVDDKDVKEARDPKAAAALSKQAAELERNGKWADARALYQRLANNPAYAGEAAYHQALAAFQLMLYGEAEELAKAASLHAAVRNRALLLYGDAIVKQGDVRRAKDFFVGLRKQLAGDDRATATRKIAACNKALKLPELDGIRD